MSTRTELVVEMTCASCVDLVRGALEPLHGIDTIDISLDSRQVVVTGTTPTSDLVRALRAAGLRVAVAGKSSSSAHLGSAVAQFVGPAVQGVIFFTQLSEADCLVGILIFKD
jgi:copper chaperone CopZ